ncbi:MAG: response regulator [Desulfatitalea sp.]|nr:response regulator [Desulfatitalea sp.]
MQSDVSNTAARPPRRSLSRALTNQLIVTVALIFMLATIGNYLFFTQRSKTLHEAKASEYLVYLGDSLEVPLWNIDKDWIKSICDSFAKNETVALLRVSDETGAYLFETFPADPNHLIRKSSAVHHRGNLIGRIEIGLTTRIYERSNNHFLLGSILTLIVVVTGMALSTKLILNRIINKPLSHLMVRIDQISSGEYRPVPELLEHREIFRILDKFNFMAGEVKRREFSLRETNRQLASEISERQSVEDALRESEQRYRQLVEELPVGLFRVSPREEGAFLMVNPAFVRMFGYQSKDQVTVQSVQELYRYPDMRKHVMEMLHAEQSLQGLEVAFKKRDGSSLIGLVTAHVVTDANGTPLYIDGIIEEITERKRLENQIRQRQKMEAIGTLAGGIAHDFNNILASIFGFAEAAKLQYARGAPIQSHLDEILNGGLRARSLIKQILAFSRQTEVAKGATAIVPILKETVKFLRASLPALIEIRLVVQVKEVLVWADPTQIHQVLMNLCTNAAHAMKSHGGLLEVTLDEVSLDDEAVSKYGDMAAGTYVRLTVSDEGHGIQQEYIERIFEPFFTTKERGEGTGMGLAVIHGIVNDMGGTINVASGLEKGSVFQVLWPRYRGAPPPFEGALPAPVKGRGNILFVDDEKGFLASGKEILEQIGYSVTTAANAPQALAAFAADVHKFDLVITDLVMPKMTGLDLTQRLRKLRPDLTIILCTGFSDNILSINKEVVGIADVVMKPLLAGELTSAIERALKGK